MVSKGWTRCQWQHQPIQGKTRRTGIFTDTRSRLWRNFLCCCQILKYQNTASLGKRIWFRSSSNGCQDSFPEWNSQPWHLYVSAEWFIDPDHPDYVYKLRKSLYGLKQSARCWNQTLNNFLLTYGYRRSPADECIYVKTVKKDDGFISFVILAVYVDNIIPPVSSDVKMLNAEKESYGNNLKWSIWEKFTSSLECQSKETELLGHWPLVKGSTLKIWSNDLE